MSFAFRMGRERCLAMQGIFNPIFDMFSTTMYFWPSEIRQNAREFLSHKSWAISRLPHVAPEFLSNTDYFLVKIKKRVGVRHLLLHVYFLKILRHRQPGLAE